MIARLLFILYKQEDHIIPKYYYTILRIIFCLSYFVAICIFANISELNIHLSPIEIIILLLTTIVIPADLLDHTGHEEDILLQNLEYTFISKTSQPKIIYDASKNMDIVFYHDIASSELIATMLSYTFDKIQATKQFKVLRKNKTLYDYEDYYMGENHIDDDSKAKYEIEKIEVYDAKIKTTVFKRKAIKTVKMIDFHWKGKDR